ncbi:MAG TPA: serine hydrolase domain-containing protein [Chryseosolibacter sp.]|jgi:Beta-lactamase class C and other penicillin binding proteins
MSKKKVIGGTLVIVLIIFTMVMKFQAREVVKESHIAPVPIEPALPNPYVEKLLAHYEEEMVDLFNKTKTPGLAIAIVQDSTILFMKTYGVREVGTTDSVDVHTVFRLASVSKCFAPLLTGLLVEDSALAWNDRVIDHLTNFELKSKESTDSLRLTHVMSHTTGLPYHTYTTLVEDGIDLPSMLQELKNVNTNAEPGEVYSYQNVAYSIIGEVIRSRMGKSYQTLMEERVFNPLNMKDASMSYEAIMSNKNVAQPHLHWRKGWKSTKILDTYYNVGPAGGMNASISDMAQWLKAMLGSKDGFISAPTLDKIFTPVVKARTKNRYFRKWVGRSDSQYALGWRVLNFENDTLLYHGGYVRGYRSEVAIDRRSGIGICVLSNGPGRLVDTSVPMFFNMFYNQRDSILYWQNNQMTVDQVTVSNGRAEETRLDLN